MLSWNLVAGTNHQVWRHPRDQSWKFNDISHWVELAKLLEKGNIHGIFIADVLVSSTATVFPQVTRLTQPRAHTTSTRARATQTRLWCRELSGPSMNP